eukprot:11221008-Lingulodinium_polyedra.AAC.1
MHLLYNTPNNSNAPTLLETVSRRRTGSQNTESPLCAQNGELPLCEFTRVHKNGNWPLRELAKAARTLADGVLGLTKS